MFIIHKKNSEPNCSNDSSRFCVLNSFRLLDEYCKKAGYMGWDVFDALNSRTFRKSPFYKSKLFRLVWIQFFKRSPVNFRILAGVPEAHNPKGLGLFASGLVRMGRLEEALGLLKLLEPLASHMAGGTGWGYNFPWQARAFYVPADKPNMVVTAFVAEAFLDYFEATGDEAYLEIGRMACAFLLNALVLEEVADRLCFGYVPGEPRRVHNANMLGAALLGRVHRLTGDPVYLEKSTKAMAYSMAALDERGHWPYGVGAAEGFIDNFHTGFNLTALKRWMTDVGDYQWEADMNRAYERFLLDFWMEDGRPKYYHDHLYPVDVHCSAQGIVTTTVLAVHHPESRKRREKIFKWVIDHMQLSDGAFAYQKTPWYLNKTRYMRWSQAWMFYALALYLSDGHPDND